MSGIRDNHSRGNIGDFLREKIRAEADLSFVSAYFTIYAYEAMTRVNRPETRPIST